MFSDSHGRIDSARKVIKDIGQVDLLLHAGDFYSDALVLSEGSSLPFKAVLGNCDGAVEGPEEELFELSGHRFLMTHGHLNGINRLGSLLKKAREYGVEAVIFGHTHVPQIIKMDGILFFNPGSISRPRDQDRPSYGIIEVGADGIVPSIQYL